ncbi:MAG: hypothetical protein FD153_37 [Rhodospirillaceae bacterium]|nr:MAG: hypothetical protein FD153_37 [Rhodospirillaceae bacterium]
MNGTSILFRRSDALSIVCALHVPAYGTVIGSDRQVTADYLSSSKANGKWAIGPYWCAGATGPLCALTLLEEHAQRLLAAAMTPFKFVSEYRQLLVDSGWEPDKTNGRPKMYNVSLVLTSPRALYSIGGDGSINQVDWVACGSGGELATGAAHVLRHQNASPEDIVYSAVDAAIQHSSSCGFGVWMRLLPDTSA